MVGSIAQSLAAVATLLVAGSLAGCNAAADSIKSIESAAGVAADAPGLTSAADAVKALAQLEYIPVKGRAPKTGYTRNEFGPVWADVDHNGCDTRNDILARDLVEKTFKVGTNKCVVATGVLADKYTGATIKFVRGPHTSKQVQIDHVVALSDAWQKGAQQLSADQRTQLANDPMNLIATDGATNRAKGDKDAATWLPPNKAFRCEYVTRQAAVKAKYSLWVTEAEHTVMVGILSSCSKALSSYHRGATLVVTMPS